MFTGRVKINKISVSTKIIDIMYTYLYIDMVVLETDYIEKKICPFRDFLDVFEIMGCCG